MGLEKLVKHSLPAMKSMGTKYTAKEVVSILPIVGFTELKKFTFSEIIDVRTPLEFAEDRIRGAINLPVLNNEQRAEVGTLYCSDKLKGRKVGAALISRNISDHILDHFKDKDLNYKPLIYCWRGGQRSRSMATILKEIGFQPVLLQGGYKAYRQHVCSYLCQEKTEDQPLTNLDKIRLVRISGATGSGKTLLLKALKARGEQILDLEDLAKHKGSILGDYPSENQPSQKGFESDLFNDVEELSPSSVVWIENEGSRVGNIGVSRRVWEKMCISPRLHISVSMEDRIDYILHDYKYLIDDPSLNLPGLLKRLEKHAGKKTYTLWMDMLEKKEYRDLVSSLIQYYDASYKVPTGEAISEMTVPGGYLLDEDILTSSQFITDLIARGREYMSVQLDESNLNQKENKMNKLETNRSETNGLETNGLETNKIEESSKAVNSVVS